VSKLSEMNTAETNTLPTIKPIRVLICDDQEQTRASIRSALKPAEDVVVIGEAGNGRNVISQARELDPDIIIMDLNMPDGDGITAIRELIQEGTRAKVLVNSMYTDSYTMQTALKSGAVGYLDKCCAYEEMANAIHEVVEGRVYLSPSLRFAASKMKFRAGAEAETPQGPGSSQLCAPEQAAAARAIENTRLPTAESTPDDQRKPPVLTPDNSQLEEKLLQAQKMASVGQFLGVVAHDFNNSLTAMLLNMSLIERNSTLNSEAQQTILELENQCRHAADLSKQLLLFSRRSAVHFEKKDVNAVVGGMVPLLKRLLGNPISIEWRETSGLPPVEADSGMLQQVVMNLCVNARDAMPGGGRLVIKSDLIELGSERNGDYSERRAGSFICLTVEDSGNGIPEDVLKRLSEPFFTTKEPGKGTGLGLASARNILQQHKGWMEVESQVGKGSVFSVFLPVAETATEAPAPTPPNSLPNMEFQTATPSLSNKLNT